MLSSFCFCPTSSHFKCIMYVFSNSLFKTKISTFKTNVDTFPIDLIMFSLTLKKRQKKCVDVLGNCQAILCRTLGSTLRGLFFWICTFLASSYQRLPPFPRKFTWQIEAGSNTETITEHDNSDDSEAKIPDIQSNVRASSVAVPFWLLKWCWASMSLVELAPLWGERYIIRNQGAQSIPIGHWWVLWVTGEMSSNVKATLGSEPTRRLYWASQ